jgi:hypothetical protein
MAMAENPSSIRAVRTARDIRTASVPGSVVGAQVDHTLVGHTLVDHTLFDHTLGQTASRLAAAKRGAGLSTGC